MLQREAALRVVGRIHFVNKVDEANAGIAGVVERDEKILRIQDAAERTMGGGEELVEIVRGAGQAPDLEQHGLHRLQALDPLQQLRVVVHDSFRMA